MEHKLDEFVAKLKVCAGQNLKAVVLYGSAVTGEFHEQHSDLNLLCVVDRADTHHLEDLHPAVKWWNRQGHPAPLFFTLDELRRSADVFAIELLDMKAHHRMLLGDDFFTDLEVSLRFHRLQVERELRTNWIRLRQAIVTAPQKKPFLLRLMVSSISAFAALFRHALIVLGEPPAENKRQAIDRIAALAASDPSGFHAILDLREGKRKESQMEIEETLHKYLELVGSVADEVDRRLAERT